MTRLIAFLILVALVGLGGAWLADRPGDVAITWLGHRVETSVLVAVATVAALILLALLAWSILRFVFGAPRRMALARRERRRRRGRRALRKGLLAVASGDMRAARRAADEAGRLAKSDPLTLLLTAQTAQLAGDRTGADAAFRAMTDNPDTRLLGLRGLFIEAQRRNDPVAARQYAEEAARAAPSLSWAGEAALNFRAAEGDWAGALAALETNFRAGLMERGAHQRQRAVLLTARALDLENTDPSAARATALEASRLAPDLVPAVALAAKLLAESRELKRASRLVETAWRRNPHPDLADVYAHLRFGDSSHDRLNRVQRLVRLRSNHPEGALAVARAALDAGEYAVARRALEPLLIEPTQRVCLLMAELEQAEHGDGGRAREWIARALRANRDPCWTADGYVSPEWRPVSPVTGRIDAFEWKVPVAEIGHERQAIEADRMARPAVHPALPPFGGALEDVGHDGGAAPLAADHALVEAADSSASSHHIPTGEVIEAAPVPAAPSTTVAAGPAQAGAAPSVTSPSSGAPDGANASAAPWRSPEPVPPAVHRPDDPGPAGDAARSPALAVGGVDPRNAAPLH